MGIALRHFSCYITHMRILRIIPLASLALILLGCAPAVITRQALQGASKVPFSEAVKHPDRYAGQNFVWGGTIVRTYRMGSGSEVEMVQNPVDGRGYITNPDVSDGRFIVASRRFLDPYVFKPGLLMTVAGRLTGGRAAMFGDTEYLFPVIQAAEIHLFSPRRVPAFFPSISVGVGVGF